MYNELKKRNLPPLKSREEMMEILQREEYGYLPNVEYKLDVSDPIVIESRYASAGRLVSKTELFSQALLI